VLHQYDALSLRPIVCTVFIFNRSSSGGEFQRRCTRAECAYVWPPRGRKGHLQHAVYNTHGTLLAAFDQFFADELEAYCRQVPTRSHSSALWLCLIGPMIVASRFADGGLPGHTSLDAANIDESERVKWKSW
jgi:hypothetical protein